MKTTKFTVHDDYVLFYFFYEKLFGKSRLTAINEITIHEKKKTGHFTFH